jgi:hypothetical protein
MEHAVDERVLRDGQVGDVSGVAAGDAHRVPGRVRRGMVVIAPGCGGAHGRDRGRGHWVWVAGVVRVRRRLTSVMAARAADSSTMPLPSAKAAISIPSIVVERCAKKPTPGGLPTLANQGAEAVDRPHGPGGQGAGRERTTGVLDSAAGLRSGDHVCWTYGSDEERRQSLTSFFAEGAEGGEQLAYWALEGSGDPLLEGLRDTRAQIDALVTGGRLVVQSAQAVYTPDGSFDPEAMLDKFRVLATQAVQQGRSGLRVATEVAWLLGHPDAAEHWDSYELRVDLLAAELPLTVMCGYDLRICDPAAMTILQSVHQLVLTPPASHDMPPFALHGTGDGGLGLEGELDFSWAEVVESLLTAAAGALETST